MEKTIVGYQSVEFEKNGFKCKGVNFYLVSDDSRSGLVGCSTDKVYVSEKILAECNINLKDVNVGESTIRVYYNRYGRVEAVVIE